MSNFLAPLAITCGEPAGIGPDICLELASCSEDANLVFVGDPKVLEKRAELLGKRTPERIEAIEFPEEVIPGRLNATNAPQVLESLHRSVEGCLNGRFSALVTAPIHKGVINDAGISFRGHTEYLAELAGGEPVMMLVAPEIRVALVTTHLPLVDVPAAVTKERIELVTRVLHTELQTRFNLESPRILVCGLNPHAGEGGHLGCEEIEQIEPALRQLRTEGINCVGSLPADSLFTPEKLAHADVVLAMYHDQGLPVLKYLGFGRAVNVTLGLPLIRTSVDHGTALELAGSGRADAGSLIAAVALARELTANVAR